jgi:hypothetical protein
MVHGMNRLAFGVCLALLGFTNSSTAHEPSSPKSLTYDYSPYEQETIDITLERLGAQIDPEPEGKIVEKVEIITLEVIEERDPVPRVLNVFHVVSQKHTVQREVLIQSGEPYRKVLVDETARNLRALPQFSVVLCVPVREARNDRVRLLIITKDIWSLRLNSDIRYSSGGLEYLVLQPSEINLFGSHHTASLRFELDPASWVGGVQYVIPRMTQHHLWASALGNVVTNRETGKPEGSSRGIALGRRALTARTPWSWLTSTTWQNLITRRFINAKQAYFETSDGNAIPYAYRTRRVNHSTSVTRSMGWAVKNDISFGAEYDHREYEVPDEDTWDPVTVRAFRSARVPSNDTRLSPFLQYSGYTTDFLRVLDFETLGLQEDFRLGHHFVLKLYPASRQLGSSRSLLGLFAAGQYTIPILDGLVRVSAQSETEAEGDRLADASIQGNWRVITPRLGFGRLLVDTMVLHRYRNFMNRSTYSGGNGRLRGFPSNYFVGDNLVANNIEYRSSAMEIMKLQVGGALFYDTGGVYDQQESFRLNHSVGFGMRALFPQLDRTVFRMDVGFPVTQNKLPPGVSPTSFFVAIEQAFPMPSIHEP